MEGGGGEEGKEEEEEEAVGTAVIAEGWDISAAELVMSWKNDAKGSSDEIENGVRFEGVGRVGVGCEGV